MKKKKVKKAPGQQIQSLQSLHEFEERQRQLTIEHSRVFSQSISAISEKLKAYSARDITSSLFTSSLWLPNIASLVTHQFLLAIFLSLDPNELSGLDKIDSYDDFNNFLRQIQPNFPTFPHLEDYVPELEWGQVRFHHQGQNFRIFYGSDLESAYDFLTHFQMMHCSMDKEYVEQIGHSPSQDLFLTLKFQDDIIGGITKQPKPENLPEIHPGHFEVPNEEFWRETKCFLNQYSLLDELGLPFVSRYSIELGSVKKEILTAEAFEDSYDVGSIIPACFVKIASEFLPIVPRMMTGILLDSWFAAYEKTKNVLFPSRRTPITLRIGSELHRYLKDRVRTDALFPYVSALAKNNQADEVVFSSAFVSKNRLILFLVMPPSTGGDILKHLRQNTNKFKRAHRLLLHQPTRLAVLGEHRSVEFRRGSASKGPLVPTIFYVLPRSSLSLGFFMVPKNLPGNFILLEQLLGIIDELDDIGEFAEFLDFIDDLERRLPSPFNSWLDKFGAFKGSHGVLIDGAVEPDEIFLDPHWGSAMRHETLAKFWRIFPEVGFWGHPRAWNVIQESPTSIRLDARGFHGCAMYCRVTLTHIYINSLFEKMSFDQAKIANFLLECLQDSITRQTSLIEMHTFFQTKDFLQVLIIPASLIEGNADLEYLSHLRPGDNLWVSDKGYPRPGKSGIRIVYNDKKVSDAFLQIQDSSLEIALLLEVMTQLNSFAPDNTFSQIVASLGMQKGERPRFRLFAVADRVSFPEVASYVEIGPTDFKLARKRIAEIARESGLTEGKYELEEAKQKLNTLRRRIVEEINIEVGKYHFRDSVLALISNVDALSNKNERDEISVRHSVEHEVDFNREEKLASVHADFIHLHHCYTYLIEKFVQLVPTAVVAPTNRQLSYLLAIVDWVLRIYNASDAIHYSYTPTGLIVDHDYKLEVQYPQEQESKEHTFAVEQAEIQLGLHGNQHDKVESPRPVAEYLDKLDMAFSRDLGFGLRNLVNVLQVLSTWAHFKTNATVQTYYGASGDEIVEVCLGYLQDITKSQIESCMEFLTLRSGDVTKILGQSDPADDLPVWEHRKRFARYRIRPLIRIDGKYHWGPYSTRMAAILWSRSGELLPIDLESANIEIVVDEERKLISQALVDKGSDIIRRFTPHVRKNLKLHDLDPTGNHPEQLGDYDNLGFMPEKNILLNVECKDILPVFCMKDLRRLREKIFGRPGIDEGHFSQINLRADYLKNNSAKVLKALNWSAPEGHPPNVISIYLTRRVYWWTRYPPNPTAATFLRIDMLADFLRGL